ncbi:MAG: MATE family efflux transporter [Clostridiales bacterium]|jgi:Na+-driven multidrug efflux pump|nr:MATE family efflux transporter [Clostridiales bacterium]
MQTKDLSVGRPLRLLLLFSLPMVLSVVFQQLYNIADSVIAGRFLGKEALAAVSASYPVTIIYLCVGTGYSVGCGVVMSRAYGKKDILGLKTAVSTSFLSLAAIGVVISAAAYFTAKPLLMLLSTPPEVLEDAAAYLKFYSLGMTFVYVYNACSVTFQALGNSVIPLIFLISSTVLNVGLDLLFLRFEGAGVWSLSVATVAAQGAAAILSVAVLFGLLTQVKAEKTDGQAAEPQTAAAGKRALKIGSIAAAGRALRSMGAYICLKKPYRLFSGAIFIELIRIGVPGILQAATVSVGQLFIQNLVNSYGTDVIAGYGAAVKISAFLVQITVTEANALSIFISQNAGAGTHKRIGQGMRAGFMIILISCAATAAVGLALAPDLIALFAADEASGVVVEIGSRMLRTIVPFYFVVIIKFWADALLRGVGAMSGFVVGTLLDLVVRVGGAYLFAHLLGSETGIWWSWPAGWVVGTLTAVIFALSGRWKKRLTMLPLTR